jgi:hypothetical protein
MDEFFKKHLSIVVLLKIRYFKHILSKINILLVKKNKNKK